MSKKSKQADDVTMSGGGFYSLATLGAKHVIDAATPLVLNVVDQIPLRGDSFTLCDMGCADGGTSLSMVRSALSRIRTKAPDLPIQMVYADQPRNDYNALVKIIYGLTDFDSYLSQVDNVFPFFSGTSFYNTIVPPQTLDLGFSATAMHWLSGKPCDIPSHVHAVGAQGDELRRFQLQAASDWKTILLHRAKELKPGGRLVLVNFCRDEQGRYLGNTGGVNMFDTFNSIWRQHLDDGVIDRDEYTRMTLPQYYNDIEEFSEPLRDTSNDVHKAGLRLEHIETRIVPCPFAEEFKNHGDAKEFAKQYIPTIRTWNESIFFAGLSSERPLQERKEMIENYYTTYEDKVRESPDGHAMDYVHAYITIAKVH